MPRPVPVVMAALLGAAVAIALPALAGGYTAPQTTYECAAFGVPSNSWLPNEKQWSGTGKTGPIEANPLPLGWSPIGGANGVSSGYPAVVACHMIPVDGETATRPPRP
jgi:hypothetical protein